jgi:hypothetical protein
LQLIGWTPLVETDHIMKAERAMARIVGKLEGKQRGGSVKDCIALKYENHHDPWLVDPHNNNCNFQNMLHMHENMKERFLVSAH